jgi:HAD superfamily hydrolase (TIGR01484 family)
LKPKLIFSDFDGTITLEDELTAHFFEILSLLKSHSIPLIIVTGRSKSWAHFLLSHFHDLFEVVSEGGGVLSKVTLAGKRRVLKDELLIDELHPKKLVQVTELLLKTFPRLSLSVDSFGRQTDRAIELTDLENDKVLDQEVRSFFEGQGVNFSTSNVHMNYWCGDISKISAIKTLMKRHALGDEDVLFFGDSLNDESAFGGLPRSIGVSNVSSVLDQLKQKPKVILKGPENRGPLGVHRYLLGLLK